MAEHNLQLPGNYPVNTTYMHEGTGASSKIEYWFLGEKNDEKVAIASPDPLNISDHLEIV